MKSIKKIVAAIVGIFAAIAGVLFLVNSNKNKKQSESKAKIDENKKQVDILETAVQELEEKREAVNDQITDAVTVVNELKEAKENIQVIERTVEDAKSNILAKTSRGRKPNKKK